MNRELDEIMEQNEDLIRLAAVVEELLASYNQLKQEKRELLQTVKEKEQHIVELQNSIARLKDEKADVSQRVSGILAVLDKWEKGQETGEAKAIPENGSATLAEAAPSIFSLRG